MICLLSCFPFALTPSPQLFAETSITFTRLENLGISLPMTALALVMVIAGFVIYYLIPYSFIFRVGHFYLFVRCGAVWTTYLDRIWFNSKPSYLSFHPSELQFVLLDSHYDPDDNDPGPCHCRADCWGAKGFGLLLYWNSEWFSFLTHSMSWHEYILIFIFFMLLHYGIDSNTNELSPFSRTLSASLFDFLFGAKTEECSKWFSRTLLVGGGGCTPMRPYIGRKMLWYCWLIRIQ